MRPTRHRRLPLTAIFIPIAAALLVIMSVPLMLILVFTLETDVLAFTSFREGNSGIFLLDTTRSINYMLTINPEGAYSKPIWSPNGRLMMATFERSPGSYRIEILDVASRSLICATPYYSDISSRSWSPDGHAFMFAAYPRDNVRTDYDLYMIALNGQEIFSLTDDNNTYGPIWSPDGTSIAFTADYTGDLDLYRLWLADQTLTNLTQQGAQDRDPFWSPDGSLIAFRSLRGGVWENLLLDVDQKTVRRISSSANPPDFVPVWSPQINPMQIAFTSRRSGDAEIYIVDVLASSDVPLQRLTHHNADDLSPIWSSDGSRIAFVSNRHGNAEIYFMNADGSHLRRLTHHPAADYTPAWQP
ncbi:MAG: PD40 domain-containing protein [Chitinophagaceae bacterium]|nr:PD40 domain-containing protein [Anaerolineae bacterium]